MSVEKSLTFSQYELIPLHANCSSLLCVNTELKDAAGLHVYSMYVLHVHRRIFRNMLREHSWSAEGVLHAGGDKSVSAPTETITEPGVSLFV